MDRLRVVTLCSGYDAQCLALERLRACYDGFDYELVSWAEVDRYAIMAHDALFPQWRGRNIGDITSCDWSCIGGGIDLLTYSTPCQSISSAGRQEGLRRGSGTASSIIWSVLDAIDVLRPKYLLMENVKALVSRKFIGDFHEWQLELSRRGYTNFAKVLNARDYGVPQNRERIFMVSILDYDGEYHFPEPFPLGRRLKDVLEQEVDEKYYLSKKTIDMFMERNRIAKEKGNGFRFFTRTGEDIAAVVKTRADGVCNTITSVQKDNLVIEPYNPYDDGTCRTIKAQYYKNGMANFNRTDGLGATGVKVIGNIYDNNVQGGRIYSTKGMAPTIDTAMGGNREPKIPSYTRDANGQVVDRHLKEVANTIHGGTGGGGNTDSYVVETGYRIRKLTERECFRLMDVDDADIDKIQAAGISKSQRYKLAGNSIVTNVLFHIFRELFIDKGNESEQLTLF